MDTKSNKKIIAVVGPTASGKSELAVKIAKKYNGEIISADSRQVYRGMDIGTGKVTGSWKIHSESNKSLSSRADEGARDLSKVYIYKSIPHYGIDIASPKTQYSVTQFQKYAKKIIKDIHSRGKLPILCGGTGHWIDAVVLEQQMPQVKPNPALRKKLEKLNTTQLFAKLAKLDPQRAQTIDAKNPRRLIRALEIILSTGKPVPALTAESKYDVLWLGITTEQEKLYSKIDKRLSQRLKQNMIQEVKTLHSQGISWKRLQDFGLEYKFCALYLQNKISLQALETELSQAIKHYAKRQLTWFKRNKNIHWISKTSEALKYIK